MHSPIYLDNHASTRVDPRVVKAMLPFFTEVYGNASSRNHAFGSAAEEAVETARAQVARAIGAEPREIVFTSGATESNNLAIRGIASEMGKKGNHLITCATEHHAVLDPMRRLGQEGFDVTFLPVDRGGMIDLNELRDAMTDRTVLVSIMHGNNEIGVVHPIGEIGRLCAERDVIFHTDATQTVGKIPVDVQSMNIHALSLSAHKFCGPKGVGALYIRRRNPRVRVSPIVEGGGQERGLRSGTLNVPGIVGLGCALEICEKEMAEEAVRLAALRDRLRAHLFENLTNVHENGDPERKLPHSLNVAFEWIQSETLLLQMEEVALSTGSSCMTSNPEPSHVLRAIGLSDELAKGSVRFGLGRFNTEEEIDYVGARIVEGVKRLRGASGLAE